MPTPLLPPLKIPQRQRRRPPLIDSEYRLAGPLDPKQQDFIDGHIPSAVRGRIDQ
jgi:hypothetical protein